MKSEIGYQVHGYRNGHHLLNYSIKLNRMDQDTVDGLSDISGSIKPGETFYPYLTFYPVPSKSHYVIARTWIDLGAPRAGCVITKSLFVPMEDWLLIRDIEELASLLQNLAEHPFTREIFSFSDILSFPSENLLEFTEALFLENRQPIAVFSAANVENIAVRLLVSLWPGIRATFSLCTLAFSQRLLNGQLFDVLFVAKSARTRFNDWPGRKVDLSVGDSSPRHRWTTDIVSKVFHSNNPILLDHQLLNLLDLGASSDENTLRFSLLWNELVEKSAHSPSSVLGLLDLLASREQLNGKALSTLEKYLYRLLVSLNTFALVDAWELLLALVIKLRVIDIPAELKLSLSTAVHELVQRDPKRSSLILAEASAVNANLPIFFLFKIIDEISSFGELGAIYRIFLRFSPSLMLDALTCCPNLRKSLFKCEDLDLKQKFFETIDELLQNAAKTTVAELGEILSPLILLPSDLTILLPLLKLSGRAQFLDITSTVLENTRYDVDVINSAICACAESNDLRDEVLVRSFTSPHFQADKFIASCLSLNQYDLNFLLRAALVPRRKSAILAKMINDAGESRDQLRLLPQASVDQVFELFSDGLIAYIPSVLLLVQSNLLPSQNKRTIFFDVRRLLKKQEATLFFTSLLAAIITEDDFVDLDFIREVIRSDIQVDAERILAAYFQRLRFDKELVQLEFLDLFPKADLEIFREHINLFSNLIISKDFSKLSSKSFTIWAELILSSGKKYPDAQLDAATVVLPIALEEVNLPLEPLLKVCFPIVYSYLEEGKTTPPILTFFMFVDWDKCKTLRNKFVEKFLQSNWEPANLVLIAQQSGILREVLSYTAYQKGGKTYLKSLVSSESKLPKPILTAIRKTLRS